MRATWVGGRWTVLALVVALAAVAVGVLLATRPTSVDGVGCGTLVSPVEADPVISPDPRVDPLAETPCEAALRTRFGWAGLLVVLGAFTAVLAVLVMLVSRPEAVPRDAEEAARTQRRLLRRAWTGFALVTVLVGATVLASTRTITADGVDCGSVLSGQPDTVSTSSTSQQDACDEAGEVPHLVVYVLVGASGLAAMVSAYWGRRILSPGLAEAAYYTGVP